MHVNISLYANLFAQLFVSTGFQSFPHYEMTTVVAQHCLHTRAGKPSIWMLLSHHTSTDSAVLVGADAVCSRKTRLTSITLRLAGLLLQDAENGRCILYPVNVINKLTS